MVFTIFCRFELKIAEALGRADGTPHFWQLLFGSVEMADQSPLTWQILRSVGRGRSSTTTMIVFVKYDC